MTATPTVGDLFATGPRVWGNRGDPHLWWELRERFATTPLPADEARLRALIEEAFVAATGSAIGARDPVFVQRLAHGGLTSGYVLPKWWRETGVPLLLERAAQLRAG